MKYTTAVKRLENKGYIVERVADTRTVRAFAPNNKDVIEFIHQDDEAVAISVAGVKQINESSQYKTFCSSLKMAMEITE